MLVKKSLAQEAAKRAISEIHYSRAFRIAKDAKRYQEKKANAFFFKKQLTIQEAVDQVIENAQWPYNYENGWGTMMEAEEILKQCSISDSEYINFSRDDSLLIADYS